jgi:hypothetical protein
VINSEKKELQVEFAKIENDCRELGAIDTRVKELVIRNISRVIFLFHV